MRKLNVIFLVSTSLLFASGCASKKFNEPGIASSSKQATQRTYSSSYSNVWNATLAALQSKKYGIATQQRDGGKVETAWIIGKSDRLFSGYGETRIPYKIRFKMKIQLQPSKTGVGVSIENTEEYVSDSVTAGTDFSGSLYQWIPTKSSTAKEAALLDEIETKLDHLKSSRKSSK